MKTLRFAAVWSVFLLTACGDDGGGNTRPGDDGGLVEDGGPADDAGRADAEAGARDDGGDPDDAGADYDAGDGATDGGGEICLERCAEDDCGMVPVCNGDTVINCGSCGQGLVCGQSAPNKCGAPPPTPCTKFEEAKVCAGKCGAVSDGCSGVYQCNDSNGGLVCPQGQECIASACQERGPLCTPLTCAAQDHECGQESNGCGGSLDCGTCPTGKRCVYAGGGNTCQDIPCTKLLIATACLGTCGKVSDGCGGQLDCESSPLTACPSGETCGGGGTPGECGSGTVECVPTLAATVCAGKCGSQPDGCGGVHMCSASNGGQTCNTAIGESCGGGGITMPNVCGKPPCVAKTQAQACPMVDGMKMCGSQPDGCGGLVNCGNCDSGQQCGLTAASVCGMIPVCQPTPVATACAGKCGTVANGCGGSYTCTSQNGGTMCTGEEYCGANQRPNQCGTPPVTCTPKTCAQLGHTCGLASDGCGKTLNCWPECPANNPSCSGMCGANAACLGNGAMGEQTCVAGGPSCTGSLCSSVPTTCGASSPTRLTGTVRTPGLVVGTTTVNQLPVPNALVYIPADPGTALPPIVDGVAAGAPASCGRCGDEKLVADGQSVLASAVTDYKGAFTLEGRIPVGTPFKVVIKVGKWRRVIEVPGDVATACTTKALALQYTRLAANSGDGASGTRLPKIAISTGDVDAMECVLRNIGISQSEFTLPGGAGRIHMFRANGAIMTGATCTGTYRNNQNQTIQCTASTNAGCKNNQTGCAWSNRDGLLYADQAALNAYDLVVFDCEGNGHYRRNAAQLELLRTYVNRGGRAFASHWSYEWLDNNMEIDTASSWTSPSGDSDTTATGRVSLTTGPTARARANPVKSQLYFNWLDNQSALDMPNTPLLAITDPRGTAGATPGSSTDEWMYRIKGTNTIQVQQLSFNTPYAATEANICGRVAFSAFHVASNASGTTLDTNGLTFPAECKNAALTSQEKTLAFMLFDLATCVSTGDPPQPPTCSPKTTANLCPAENDACGALSDGCGGVVDCGGCSAGYYCDGNTCRPQQCTPSTCASLGFSCGEHADGCGGIARNAQGAEGCGTCAGGQICGLNSPGQCGGCVKIALETACPANSCGQVSDGCGGTYDCGNCTSGVCGGAGANRCGPGTCTPIPMMTACLNKNCGLVSNGCGDTYNCGTCTAPDTCGGGSKPNVCGHPECVAKTRDQACTGFECGYASDGCGGVIDCGQCANNAVCGGNGPNKCGSPCTPTTCDMEAANCGAISDGCGSLLNCGTCPAGQVCGAQMPNVCGPGTACTKRTCATANANCGLVGDGCGGVLDCGVCTSPQTCGGAGTPNQCGTGMGGCNPLSCTSQGVQCGVASDGCGAVVNCGACPSGSRCTSGQCVAVPI